MDMVFIKLGGLALAVGVVLVVLWVRPSVNAWIDRLPGNPPDDQ
jgi:hypothetical protein